MTRKKPSSVFLLALVLAVVFYVAFSQDHVDINDAGPMPDLTSR